MGRARGSPGAEISLFPFLSVLACIAGTLTLLISILSFSQMFMSAQGDKDLARAYEHARKEAAVVERERELGEIDERLAELFRLEKELVDLERKAAEVRRLQGIAADLEKLRAELERRLKELRERQKSAGEIRAEIVKLEDLLKTLERRQAAMGGPSVLVKTAEGATSAFRYSFAEAAKGGLVLHRREKRPLVPLKEIGGSKEYAAMIEEVKKEANGLLVFLIRVDGIDAYRSADGIARKAGLTPAKLPLLGGGPVDLSEFGIR